MKEEEIMPEEDLRLTACEMEDLDYIEAALTRHSDSFAPPQEGVQAERLIYKILAPAGVIIAGCVATVDTWGVLAVDTLWVSKRYRRKGLGSTLLTQMERLGREKGCYLSLVGTFDFLSPEFFDKMGYTVFRMEEDYPQGHVAYSLAKRLDERVLDKPLPYWIEVGEPEDGEYIEDQLTAYCDSRVECEHGQLPFGSKIAKEGELIAGYAGGVTQWEGGTLDMLWVAEPYRGQGVGTKLLEMAEVEAQALGARLVMISAYDWQVGFFLRRGYVVSGTLEDCPKGHTYYSLTKRL